MNEALANITGLGDDTRTDIVNSVLAGNTVTTHSMPISMGNWRGFGYVVFNPQTFSSVYMIDGGPRGGSTGCGDGDDGQAYNSFIDTSRYAGSSTNASVEPNEEEEDEDSCDYIKNVLITCLQSINEYLIDLELKGISKIIAKKLLAFIEMLIEIVDIWSETDIDIYQKIGLTILFITFFMIAGLFWEFGLAVFLVVSVILGIIMTLAKQSTKKMNKPKPEPEESRAIYIRYALFARLNICKTKMRIIACKLILEG